MNPALLVQELVQQNKLLKETISRFPLLLELDGDDVDYCSSPNLSSESEGASNSSICHSPVSSTSSVQQSAIETLLELLDRQESRLNVLEQIGRSALLESPVPIFRGLKPTPGRPEVDVKEWSNLVLNHLKCLKSLNSSPPDSKALIRFIESRLDLEPLKLMRTLLERNRLLVRSNFSHEIPSNCRSDDGALHFRLDLLYEYPFKLYVLRHPRALLNLFNSKFNNNDGPDSKILNRIPIQPGDSLLRKTSRASSRQTDCSHQLPFQ